MDIIIEAYVLYSALSLERENVRLLVHKIM